LTSFASSIEIIKPDKTTVLLSSSEKSNVLDEKENVSLDIINYPPEKFEGEKIVGVLIEDEFNSNFLELTDTKELKIKKKSSQNKMILISDGDIIANLYTPPNLHYILGYNPYNPWGHNILEGNTNFILNSIQYLCDDESLIKILNKTK
ncbi:MAG: gliding motility-associated ABC transporter substrate-binding protein GldG, partial [Flavobacteriales bacterium]|nr:gliding motility-associated ABC transporter substrate-binding protein GldG [Flavobacteriales bacterium]